MPSYVHCSIFYNSQVMETTKVSFVDEWMKKMQYIHIQWNIYFSLQSEILPFVITYMNLEGIMLSEISQTKTKLYDFTYIWNL